MKNDKINKNKLSNIDNSFLFSTSLVFAQNINKLWLFLPNIKNIIKIIDYYDNFEYIKGDNTWSIGNKFSFNWIGLTRLEFKCIYSENNANKKIIKWKAKGDIGINFYRTLCFYRITSNGKTLIKSIISRTEKRNELIDIPQSLNYYLNMEYNNLLIKSNYLNNLKDDIISYESFIVNKNFMKVWNFIVDFKKLSEVAPVVGTKIEYNGSSLKVGSFAKYYFEVLNLTVFLKISEIKMPKKQKTWIYRLDTIGTTNSNLPKSSECKVIIIDKNKTHLSISHTFSGNINQEFLKYFIINKKEAMKLYKKYLEKDD